MDAVAEINAFCNRVNEVSSLISKLNNGTVSDRDINTIPCQKRRVKTSQDPPVTSPDARRKVKQLLERQQEKERRRGQYREYLTAQGSRQEAGTDYRQWDLWCPSDEDDEVVNSCTPTNPTFKALEKDVQNRHESATRKRQIAEKARVSGNVEFKHGRFMEAYRHYIYGLEIQKHDITLQSNAAMASLKTESYTQAIFHCNKVLDIANNMLNKPHHALCLKALQRRSLAHKSLGRHKDALSDLQEALKLDPDNAEIHEEAKWLERYLKLDHDSNTLLKENDHRAEIAQLKKLLDLVSKTIDMSNIPHGLSNSLSKPLQDTLLIQKILKHLSDLVNKEEIRLVFVQLDGVSLFAKLLDSWPIIAEDVFGVLSLLCVDELVLETLIKTDAFFKNALFLSLVISGEDKKESLAEGSVSFLLAVSRYKQGRKKLLSTLFKPTSRLAEQLLHYISSNEQVLSLFMELVAETEGKELFSKKAKLLDLLLQATEEVILNFTKGVACLERPWRVCDLLSNLTSSKLIRMRIWNKEDLTKILIKAFDSINLGEEFHTLKSILALIGNCLIDADPSFLSNEADMIVLLQTLKGILRSKTKRKELHFISITTLARLASMETLKKKILEDSIAETIIELCVESPSAEMLQNASFKLLARLTMNDMNKLHTDMQIRLIDLCNEVILNSSDRALQGNAILTLSNMAKLPTLEHDFADAKLIKTLINLAHEDRGKTRRNAAICLASLSQRSSILELVRKHHGIEVMYNAMKEMK